MLNNTPPGLPAHWYYDPSQFQTEMRDIWLRQWVCVGRSDEWQEPGQFRVIHVAGQNVLVVRNRDGALRAFHNTCRHRGSILCEQDQGRLKGRIVCPYHAWSYDLDGKLLVTPRRTETGDFDPAQYSLYGVALECWGGFVFINLDESPRETVAGSFGSEAGNLDNWPLQSLKLAHREVHDVACNWKIFWENFMECYHCPGIHPELCRLVPMYSQGFTSIRDFDALGLEAPVSNGHFLRDEALTWAKGGVSGLPDLPGLDEAEINRGMTFATSLPSVFIVAHRDYVRSVRLLPVAPEQTRLTVDWLLAESAMDIAPDELENLVAFARQVVKEDGHACELNQRGLHAAPHRQGVLMPQEYDVLAFNEWVRDRLSRA